jgi:urease accessory protein UreH
MFARRADGSGGCVVDTGSRLTWVPPQALVHVQAAMLQHLQHSGAERVQRNGSGL